ncbi:MAG: hypothetical protein ABI443_04835 [Chthoniobacterales bacterium]
MKSDFRVPASILIGALLISAAIYFRPIPFTTHRNYAPCQAVAIDGFLYIIDSEKGELRKIIPTK